jgi:plasmid stabilization system protein ParE
MKVVFHIAALKEFRDERRYYNAKAPGLGDRLIGLADVTLTEIARAPHSFPRDRKHPRARRARIAGKFPHALIFRVIEADNVVVLVALEHGRRRPGFWAKRLR